MNKSELLNGLRKEYQQWEALLDQIGEARMDQPGVAADWSIKDIVAHLTGWGAEQSPAYKLHNVAKENRLHIGQRISKLTMKSMPGFMRPITNARCAKS